MREYLKSVEPALLFLMRATKSERHRKALESFQEPDELIKLAADQGFDVTRDTLTEAMKILVDRKLEKEGIPSWVRARVSL
jgi:Nif11 domain